MIRDITRVVASDVMHSPVVMVRPHDTLKKVEDEMDERGISGMPVVEDGKMVGIITQDDLIRIPAMMDALARYTYTEMQSSGPMFEGHDCDGDGIPDELSFRGKIPSMKVEEAMARHVITCEKATPLEDIIRQMVEHHIHRIVVVDDDCPVGIISTLDVMTFMVPVPVDE